MVPAECPVSRAFTSYVSLINNIYIYNKLIMESTPYFPKNYIYINNLYKYLEIQPPKLTVDLTSNQPIIPLKNVPPHKFPKAIRNSPIPPNATAIWGY
jgi:hypothetical protein